MKKRLWGGTSNFGFGVCCESGEWRLEAYADDARAHGNPGIDPDAVLNWLCDVFGGFSGPFSGSSVEEFELDFRRWGMPVLVRRAGLRVDIEIEGRRPRCMLRESVLVVEAVLTLGEALVAAGAGTEAAGRWSDVKDSCLLYAYAPEDGSFEEVPGEVEAVGRWSSEGLGQDFAYYKQAAEWLTARQRLYAAGLVAAEPSPDEWNVEAALVLPDASVVDRMLDEAALATDEDVRSLRREALSTRNFDARQVLVFRRWYGPAR